MYVILQGNFLKMEEVDKWHIDKFLTIGQYLIRKKDVENTK